MVLLSTVTFLSNFLHANYAFLIYCFESWVKSSFLHDQVIDWGIYDFVVCQRASEVAFPKRVLDKKSTDNHPESNRFGNFT